MNALTLGSSTFSASRVRETAADITARAPHIGMGTTLNFEQRGDLVRLASECGLSARATRKANDADLISIYLVARKDARAATQTARRVDMRLDDTLLSEAPPPVPLRDVPPSVDLETVRGMIKREVREGALIPVQTAIDALGREMSARIADARVEAVVEALDVVREEISASAHAAAVAALKNLQPTRLEITQGSAPPIALGLVHRKTPEIINALAAGVNVYLHGPAGSGKTTVAHKAAEAFGLKFYFAAKVESEYQLMGFKDAKGDTVRTQFREAYEHGGVFLFDEMDASSPSAVVALNAALANGMCPFPDAIVKRHADFRCLGAGNTKLTGANRQYAGRNQLDAASIDRFAFIEFGYDNDLELALAQDRDWALYVQAVRAAVAARGLNHLVTPRATYDGCKLLAAGFDRDTVASMVVYKGLDADTVQQIEAAL